MSFVIHKLNNSEQVAGRKMFDFPIQGLGDQKSSDTKIRNIGLRRRCFARPQIRKTRKKNVIGEGTSYYIKKHKLSRICVSIPCDSWKSLMPKG